MNIPTHDQCIALLEENKTPQNIIAHTKAVCAYALALSKRLAANGVEINLPLVEAAALLHDIEKLRPNHVLAGHDLIKSKGYPQVAIVMKKHGLEHLDDISYRPETIEEKIVFYADKRVLNDRVVKVGERFDYIRKKYNTPAVDLELKFTKDIETEFRELLGEDP